MSKIDLSHEVLSAIGDRIKEIRINMGPSYSQERFAEFLGVFPGISGASAQKKLSCIEKGLSAPPLALLVALSQKCGVSIDYILTGVQPGTRPATQPEAQPEKPTLSKALEVLTSLIQSGVFKVEDSGSKLSLVLDLNDEDLKAAMHQSSLEFENENIVEKYLVSFSRLYYFDTLRQFSELLSFSEKHPVTAESFSVWKSQKLDTTKEFDLLCKETASASFEHRQNLNPTFARLAVYGTKNIENPSKISIEDFLERYQKVLSL